MNILIVSATSFEVKALTEVMRLKKKHSALLSSYAYKKYNVDILITGVGMVPTAYWMGSTLAGGKYDFCLNIGLAGAFSRSLEICEVVNVESDMFPELGAESGEYLLSLIDLQLLQEDSFPFRNMGLVNDSELKSTFIEGLKKVKGITVNTVHGRDDSIKKVVDLFHPDVESMEGAAFLYACLLNDIPCLQLRAISNYVEERNKDNWDIAGAIKALNKAVLEFLIE